MKWLEWIFGARQPPRASETPVVNRHYQVAESETDDEPEDDDEIRTKVVGDSRRNDDGTSRQAIIAECRKGERLILRPEPTNRFDPNAIGVYLSSGQQIGYLSRKRAAELHSYLSPIRREIPAVIIEITGGTAAKPYRGVNIKARLPDS